MIYICALLFVLITQFSHTFEIQPPPDYENEKLFDALPENATDYQVSFIKHSIQQKNTINELSIEVKINGTIGKFILQSVDGYFAGKDTKVWLAKKQGGRMKYYLGKDIMETVNITFYHDQKTGSAITHSMNKRGISEFSGILDSDKVITPLKNDNRKRRDVSSDVFDEYNNDNTKNYHIIYKRAISLHPKEISNFSKSFILNLFGKKRSNIVYPELLVYVDTTLFEHFDKNIVDTVAYILTFWNAVDLVFRDIKNPEIRLNIAGIVLCENQIIPNKPFVVKDENYIQFSKFMYNEDKFKIREDYDIAILLGADPDFTNGTVGQAYLGGACSRSFRYSSIYSVTLILDDTKLYSIKCAAHELAHLFGVTHDGEKDLAHDCPFDDGFIMSYKSYDIKQFYFSECSKKTLSHFFKWDRQAQCLYNNPADDRTDKQILRILPGKYMTADEQCQRYGLGRAIIADSNFCINISCYVSETRTAIANIPALDGTSCDTNKFCLMGECTEIKFNETDVKSNAKILFLPSIVRVNI